MNIRGVFKTQFWLLRIAGVLAFAMLLWAFCYLKALNPLNVLNAHLGKDSMPGVSIRFDGVKLVGWSGGKRLWRIESEHVDVDKSQVHAIFTGRIKGEIFTDGRRIGEIRADRMVYNISSNDVFVPETAEFRLDKGPVIKVTKAYWRAQKSRLACTGGADAVFGTDTVHGGKLYLDLPNKEIMMTKVNGTIK